jgi:tol-pal system protein YbgF
MRHTLTLRGFLALVTCLGGLTLVSMPAHAQRYDPTLNNRIDTLEKKIEHLGRTPVQSTGSMSSLQVELSKIQEELRTIRGGIEENRFAIEQLQRDNKLAAEDYDYRLRSLEEKGGAAAIPSAVPNVPSAVSTPATPAPTMTPPVQPPVMQPPAGFAPPPPPPVKTPAPVLAPTAQTPAPPLAPVAVAPTVVPTPTAAPVTTSTGMNFTDAHEHYNYAVSLVKNKQYPEAQTSFKQFVSDHKDDKLVGNAYYWLGETYYVNSNFVTAADTFRQGFETNPNGIKAPDNLYKLAKSLLHLNKKSEACIVLGQIQKRYKTRNPEVVGLAFETQKANNCQ